jgi:hypothetical protein
LLLLTGEVHDCKGAGPEFVHLEGQDAGSGDVKSSLEAVLDRSAAGSPGGQILHEVGDVLVVVQVDPEQQLLMILRKRQALKAHSLTMPAQERDLHDVQHGGRALRVHPVEHLIVPALG